MKTGTFRSELFAELREPLWIFGFILGISGLVTISFGGIAVGLGIGLCLPGCMFMVISNKLHAKTKVSTEKPEEKK